MVSISVSRERGATKDHFFFPYPNRPREGTIPLSLPQLQKGGPPGGRNPSRPRGGLVAGGSADPRRRGPRAGGCAALTSQPPLPGTLLGAWRAQEALEFFWRTLRQLWEGNAYESNLRSRASELSVGFTERLRLSRFPFFLRCVAFRDPIFVAEATI